MIDPRAIPFEIHFKGCLFEQTVEIAVASPKQYVLYKNIKFHNCSYRDARVLIRDITFKSQIEFYSDTSTNSRFPSLTIMDVKMVGDAKLSFSGYDISYCILNRINQNHGVTIGKGGVMISRTQLGELKLANAVSYLSVDSSIISKFDSENAVIFGLLINKSEIKSRFRITAYDTITKLKIQNSKCTSNFVIAYSSKLHRDHLKGSTLSVLDVSLVNIDCPRVFLDGIRVAMRLYIGNFPKQDSKITVRGCNLKELLFVQEFKGTFRCYNSIIKSISFNHSLNEGIISLSQNYTEDQTCRIKSSNSDWGKVDFTNLLFSNDSHIVSSKLTGITYQSCRWFDSLRSDSNTSHDRDLLRDTFRQLKIVAEKNGDRIQAVKFRRAEYVLEEKKSSFVAVLKKFLLSLPPWKQNSIKEAWVTLLDKSILFLNEISNDFGNDWLRPILLIFLVLNPISFFFYVIIFSQKLTYYGSFDLSLLVSECLNMKFIYFKLMNPTLSASAYMGDLVKIQPSFAISCLEFLHKTLLAFLLVQSVSAFRKYIRE